MARAIYFNQSLSDAGNAFFTVELALIHNICEIWSWFKPITLKMGNKSSGDCPQLKEIALSGPEPKFWAYRDDKYIRQVPPLPVTRFQNSSRQVPPWRVTDELNLIVHSKFEQESPRGERQPIWSKFKPFCLLLPMIRPRIFSAPWLDS
jgi:hypothetical protein